MKVGIIEPVGGHAGMDFYDYGLAMGLSLADVQVYLFTCKETIERKYKNVSTIKTFQKTWSRSNKVFKLLSFLKEHYKSYKIAKKKKIELLHFHFFELDLKNYLIIRLAKFMGFKIVLTIHDIKSFQGSKASQYTKKIIEISDAFIVHNETSFKELSQYVRAKSIKIIPHGNYLPFIERCESRTVDEEAPLKILFFGQIKQVKGLDILLDALSILKSKNINVHLTIAGKFWKVDSEYYANLIENLQIENMITGHYQYIPNEDVRSFFEETDLVILPYRRIYQSGVLLLSMSYGKPLLTSDIEAFTEIIKDKKNGFTFKNESAHSLADVLEMIANNKDQLSQIQKQADETILNEFDWKKIGERTCREVYNVLLT